MTTLTEKQVADNAIRAESGRVACEDVRKDAGLPRRNVDTELVEGTCIDTICNVLHYVQSIGGKPVEAIAQACDYFDAETGENVITQAAAEIHSMPAALAALREADRLMEAAAAFYGQTFAKKEDGTRDEDQPGDLSACDFLCGFGDIDHAMEACRAQIAAALQGQAAVNEPSGGDALIVGYTAEQLRESLIDSIEDADPDYSGLDESTKDRIVAAFMEQHGDGFRERGMEHLSELLCECTTNFIVRGGLTAALAAESKIGGAQ